MAHRRQDLARRRKAAGHSQESFAAALGVDRSTIARWERGQTAPQPWQRPRIAEILRLSVNEVLGLFSESTTAEVIQSPVEHGPTPETERAHELYVRGSGLLPANDRQDVEVARTLLDRAVAGNPQFARALAARGYATWRQYFAGWVKHAGALDSALDDVRRALVADPDSVTAHMTFVRVCWDMGWHEQALQTGRAVFERNAGSLDATIAYARALNNAGLAQYALPLVDQVLGVDPTYPAAVKLRVWCHMLIGNHESAVGYFDQYIARHPTDANTRWAAALASAHLPSGLDRALAIADEATVADPEDPTVWLLLGYLHRAAGDEQSASQTWQLGLDQTLPPGSVVSSLRLRAWTANLYAAVGDDKAALRAVEEIKRDAPVNAYLAYRSAHVLAELGRTTDAVEAIVGAVHDGFRSVQLARRERRLALGAIHGDDFDRAMDLMAAATAVSEVTHASGLPHADIRLPEGTDHT